jgi:hypothetical protein
MQLSTSDPLALLVATYAVVVSTILAIREIRKDRRKITVTCKVFGLVIGNQTKWKTIEVRAINNGHRPVEVVNVGLNSRRHRLIDPKFASDQSSLPARISDGESVPFSFDYAEIEKAFKGQGVSNFACTSAFVCDAQGKQYKSGRPKIVKDELTL